MVKETGLGTPDGHKNGDGGNPFDFFQDFFRGVLAVIVLIGILGTGTVIVALYVVFHLLGLL